MEGDTQANARERARARGEERDGASSVRCGFAARQLRRAGGLLVALASCRASTATQPPALSQDAREDAIAITVHDPPAPPPAFDEPDRRARLAAAFPKIEAELADARREHHIPGLAAGIVVDGALAWSRGFGVRNTKREDPVTPSTVFRVGSITKTFTAAAVLGLRDRGVVALDHPAAAYLPALGQLVYPTADARPVTLRHLMTHTSGLPRLGDFDYTDPDRPLTRARMLESLAGFALLEEPGEERRYSNLGAQLVGLVIEEVTGERYRDHVSRTILAPLGMRASAWDADDVPDAVLATPYAPRNGAIVEQPPWPMAAGEAAGGLYSSVEDLARYAAAQLDAWPPRQGSDDGFLRRATIRESHRPQVLTGLHVSVRPGGEVPTVEGQAASQGLGWIVEQDCRFDHVVWHNGGTEGYKAALYMLPRRGVAVILLANLAGAPLDGLARDALLRLHETGALAPRRPRPSPALERRAGELLALYERWSDELYARVFTDTSREPVPAERLRPALEQLRAELGACSSIEPNKLGSAREGAFVMKCERGELLAVLEIASMRSQPIIRVRVHVRGGPADAEVAQAARDSLALIERWDDAAFERLFLPAFRVDPFREFVADVQREFGRCELGEVLRHDKRGAEFRLACALQPARMTVGLAEESRKIGYYTIRATERRRCQGAAIDGSN